MLNPDELLDQIRRTVDHPATVRELLERLGWPRNQRTTLRRRLAVLVERGDLIRIRGHRYGLPESTLRAICGGNLERLLGNGQETRRDTER